MIFLLIFFLSWLSGLFVILLIAFILYDSFSIIDITSFAVFTFVGCLIVIPLIYLLVLKYSKRKITGKKQFIYFPASLALLANLPVYFIIWLNTNDLYGKNEAFLFFTAFFTTAIVFGIAWAWKEKVLGKKAQ